MPSTIAFCREMASSLIRCATMALLLSASSVADEPKLDDPSAEQILDRMVKAYADCKTLYLVRRMDEQHKFDGFRTEDTTTYDPVIDEEFEVKMLEFAPPVRK